MVKKSNNHQCFRVFIKIKQKHKKFDQMFSKKRPIESLKFSFKILFLLWVGVLFVYSIFLNFEKQPVFKEVNASVTKQINYQGKLTLSNSWAAPDGSYDMRFKIYDAVSGGNLLWSGIHTTSNGNPVSVSNGIFSILLGSGTGNALNLDFSGASYFLQIEIYNSGNSTWETFSPRKSMASVPQAYNANNVIGDGRIDVVTTDNSNASLKVTQSGTGDVAQFFDGSTQVLTVKDGGNVGIGTTNPGYKLDVSGSANVSSSSAYYHGGTNVLWRGAGALSGNLFLGGGGASANNSEWIYGMNNLGVGINTLTGLTTGYNNTVLNSGAGITSGYQNVFIGAGSTSNISNTIAIGYRSMESAVAGNNVAIGNLSMLYMRSSYNVAVGENSLANLSGGSPTGNVRNVALGYNAGLLSSSANVADNIFIGYNAGNTVGSSFANNIAIGTDTLYSATGNTNTVSIGYQSGYSTTGSGNIFLGYQAGYSETGSNKLYIDNSNTASPLLYGDFGTNALTVNGTLNVTGVSTFSGDLLPSANDTYSLGSDTMRWANAWLGAETIHVGTADADEGEIGYDTTNNVMTVQSNGNLALQASSGNVGIGTTNPGEKLEVSGGLRLGNSSNSNQGTLRWDGSNLQLYNSQSYWENLSVGNLTKDPTGFPNRTDTSLSFNNSTHEFTITGTNFKVYIAGKEYNKNTETIDLDPVSAGNLYFVYYNSSGNLTSSLQPWDISNTVQVATIYWDGTTGLIGDERHGVAMDGITHEYLHKTVGTRYDTGLSGTFDNSTFSISSGSVYDEDIKISTSGATTAARVFYRNASGFTYTSPQSAYYTNSTGVLDYDNSGTRSAVASGNYVAYWAFATNDPSSPIYFLMGQRVDGNITNARNNNTYQSLSLGTLPFAEMKLLYRVILRNVSGSVNYIESQDMRNISNLPSGTYVATAHGVLTGLNNDDHVQYALLAGRTGGQTLIGGSAENETLNLQANSASTSNILTSPAINLKVGDSGATTALTVLNSGNVGIGTTNPIYSIDVQGSNGAAIASLENAGINTYLRFKGTNRTMRMGVEGARDFVVYSDTSSSYRMIIDSSGNVGINATGPDRKLDVLDASNPQIRLTHTDGTVYTDLQTTSAGNLYINPSGGNVGIGTTAPSEKLSVTGNILSTGNIYPNNQSVYGFKGNDVYTDTINTGITNDALEINYRTAGPVKVCASASCATFSAYFSTNSNVGIGTTCQPLHLVNQFDQLFK